MAVFSMSFITLFSGILIARDRGTSFLARLLASPMTASDFILGYAFPLLPAAVVQTAVCLATAFALGLPAGSGALLCVVALLPSALLFVGLGLLFGCLFSEKQVAPLSSVLVNVVSLLGGVWFDVSLLGGALKTFCEVLPFTHCVYAARYGLSGDMGAALPHMLIVLAYAAAVFVTAVLVFKRRMRSGNP
jgi:ABC-2 type transport system permease protein